MQGAREYAKLIPTGQYGKLYCMSDRHARGRTFHIYVLPKEEDAVNTEGSLSLTDAVEVYGIIGGNPGWTEWYGWLHQGEWQKDFMDLVDSARIKREKEKVKEEKIKAARHQKEERRKLDLLSKY